jgi:predicted RNase H-like HicB family nuclease
MHQREKGPARRAILETNETETRYSNKCRSGPASKSRKQSIASEEDAMSQRYTIQVSVYPGEESGYVAECLNLAVVTQGATLDETVKNLKEAIQLHLEGENLLEMGLSPHPPILVTFEIAPVYA